MIPQLVAPAVNISAAEVEIKQEDAIPDGGLSRFEQARANASSIAREEKTVLKKEGVS